MFVLYPLVYIRAVPSTAPIFHRQMLHNLDHDDDCITDAASTPPLTINIKHAHR